ncbi:hypothetical protein K438DRAFT_1630281 [Mycena galopus ATCC 62051]|nr:hypothetical protein K438DRAFT_1630281 [Mycena galopus ATCC 62051]
MNIAQIQPRYIFARTKPVHSSQTKKQPLSCFFCRKRKIACVRNDDAEGRTDAPCTQCTRRHLECRYPAISRRGQHARKDLLCGSDSPSGSPPADAAPDPDSP